MLKIKNGIVIEGTFDKPELHLDMRKFVKRVAKEEFSTIIIDSEIDNFEDRCIAVTGRLADAGLQYGNNYVIARAGYES